MLEEKLQARTEIIVIRLAVTRMREPILWATSIAKRPDLALLTLGRKTVALVLSEFALLG